MQLNIFALGSGFGFFFSGMNKLSVFYILTGELTMKGLTSGSGDLSPS